MQKVMLQLAKKPRRRIFALVPMGDFVRTNFW